MTITTSDAAAQLQQYIDRLERLEDEIKEVRTQFNEVILEAKGSGFDTKVLRQVLKIRKMKPHERLEQEEILATYLHALDMEDA
ncbi:MAG: DUF2312 domain-containing protein [Pseudomonadota bacterium]